MKNVATSSMLSVQVGVDHELSPNHVPKRLSDISSP